MKRGLIAGLIGLLLVPPGQAAVIEQDTTWRGNITVSEDIRVSEGANLTVSPGSVVTFVSAGLEVAGRMTAENARFTGKDWPGVVFRGNRADSTIRNCTFEGAETGIFVNGAAPLIEETLLRGNGVGIELKQKSAATIRNNRFIQNRKVGLFIKDESAPVVEKNRFEENGRSGAYIYRATPKSFSGNHFLRNDTGLTVSNAGSDPLVRSNRFEKNKIAMLVDRAARPDIRENLFFDNQVAIRLYRRADARISANRFEQNRDALSIAYSSYPEIRDNDFLLNRNAIFLEYQSSSWEKIMGENTRAGEVASRGAFGQGNGHAAEAAELRRPGRLDGTIDAQRNWWGPDGTAELNRLDETGNPSFINDGRDRPTFVDGHREWPLDRVLLTPWHQESHAAVKD